MKFPREGSLVSGPQKHARDERLRAVLNAQIMQRSAALALARSRANSAG